MATGMASNRCSKCQKGEGMCNCAGCKAFFCIKHFNEHRRELMDQFDHDIGVEFNKLLEQIRQPKPSNNSSADLFRQINRWEAAVIEKVHKAAEGARQQLAELIKLQQNRLTDQFKALKEEVDNRRGEENFAEDDIKRLQREINKLQRSVEELTRPSNVKLIFGGNNQIDWDRVIYVEQTAPQIVIDIPANATWTHNGITVAGGNGKGSGLNQLSVPFGLYVDDDLTGYVSDRGNHRIVEWKCDATSGQVVAGGNGQGNRTDQFYNPTDVIVDKQTDSLIICDRGNRRVVRWLCRSDIGGQTIISDVYCFGLTMDDEGFLYVCDDEKHEVRRWRVGENRGTVVAGGNGRGHHLDQLNYPRYVFVDRDHSVYVSDRDNDRVMKWVKGVKEGIVVAGGQGKGNALTQLYHPHGVVVDQLGTVYVVDCGNHRIMRWPKGTTQGSVIVGGHGQGNRANQLNYPASLSFDRQGNLFVVDKDNQRVQRFSINGHS